MHECTKIQLALQVNAAQLSSIAGHCCTHFFKQACIQTHTHAHTYARAHTHTHTHHIISHWRSTHQHYAKSECTFAFRNTSIYSLLSNIRAFSPFLSTSSVAMIKTPGLSRRNAKTVLKRQLKIGQSRRTAKSQTHRTSTARTLPVGWRHLEPFETIPRWETSTLRRNQVETSIGCSKKSFHFRLWIFLKDILGLPINEINVSNLQQHKQNIGILTCTV